VSQHGSHGTTENPSKKHPDVLLKTAQRSFKVIFSQKATLSLLPHSSFFDPLIFTMAEEGIPPKPVRSREYMER
jgi:hypothetical protein